LNTQKNDKYEGGASLPSQIRVLAIDDDAEVLDLYKTIFIDVSLGISNEMENFASLLGLDGDKDRAPLPFKVNLDLYTNGEEGVEGIRQSLAEDNPYAIIFLDMRMPGGWDGFNTAKKIREIDPTLRIIFISSYMDTSMVQMREALGPNFAYMAKPFNREELIQSTLLLGCDWYREKRLLDTEKNLRSALQQAQEFRRERDQFFSSVSYELRAPLTVLIGMSEVLSESSLNEDQSHLLKTMEVAARGQLALINDILDLSKIEADKFTIDEVPFSLSKLVAEIDQMFSLRADHSGLHFEVIQDSIPEYKVLGDAKRVSQIVINLLENALKFTEKGEVRLIVWVDELLHFRVESSGGGGEVFESPSQLHEESNKATSRYNGEAQIGVNVTRSLVELMGGTYETASLTRGETSFQVNLPLKLSDLIADQSGEGADKSSSQRRLKGSVLLAEDSAEIQLVVKRMLEAVGVTVTLAKNGQEAIDAALISSFDLILMDMEMPYVDGVEATRSLRGLGVETAIVALTGNVLPQHREAFKVAGCDGFLEKPIDHEMLLDTLKEYLSVDELFDFAETFGDGSEPTVFEDELMDIFIASLKQKRQKIVDIFSGADWSKIRKLAHAIKGSAATFGYPDLTRVGKEICDAIDNGDREPPTDKVFELLVEIDKLDSV